MKLSLLAIVAAGLVGMGTAHSAKSNPSAVSTLEPTVEPTPLHCQVPCGVYTDKMRIDMLMEDCETIAKAMGEISKEAEGALGAQQMIRWVNTKEDHAQKIQDTVSAYWLTQRIQRPGEGEDLAKYHRQLTLLHGMLTEAMKCKQTLDTQHVQNLRQLAKDFSASYFSKEDLEHLKGHHWK